MDLCKRSRATWIICHKSLFILIEWKTHIYLTLNRLQWSNRVANVWLWMEIVVHWPFSKTTNSKFKNSLCRIDHGHVQYRSIYTAKYSRVQQKIGGKFFAQTQYNTINWMSFVSVQHLKFDTIYRWSRSWYLGFALNARKETEEAQKNIQPNQLTTLNWNTKWIDLKRRRKKF